MNGTLSAIPAGDGFAGAAVAAQNPSEAGSFDPAGSWVPNLSERTFPVYALDEDIAVRAGGDFVTLCPAWQMIATGNDGYFTAGSPWTLNSNAINFAANQVQPGMVVQLTAPKVVFPGGGLLLAVDSVSPAGALNLRKLHQQPGAGQPPVPPAGQTNVTFAINTLWPQIEEASFDIKRRFAIDENIVDRTSSWIYDLRDLRMVTVLQVLLARYIQEARGDKGDFPRKIELIRCELSGVLDRVEVRWGTYGDSEPPTTIGFGFRLKR